MSDRAATAHRMNRVSVSPKRSPANVPDGVCRASMTASIQKEAAVPGYCGRSQSVIRLTLSFAVAPCIVRTWIALKVDSR